MYYIYVTELRTHKGPLDCELTGAVDFAIYESGKAIS